MKRGARRRAPLIIRRGRKLADRARLGLRAERRIARALGFLAGLLERHCLLGDIALGLGRAAPRGTSHETVFGHAVAGLGETLAPVADLVRQARDLVADLVAL